MMMNDQSRFYSVDLLIWYLKMRSVMSCAPEHKDMNMNVFYKYQNVLGQHGYQGLWAELHVIFFAHVFIFECPE